MARVIHEFDPVERFVAGTVGEPGERSFFLQARTGTRLVSVLLEKAQVLAIAERLNLLIKELVKSEPALAFATLEVDDRPLETPIMEEFRVGVIGLAWVSDRDLVQIDLQATTEESIESDEIFGDEDDSADLLRVYLTVDQTRAFVTRSFAVVASGRPPCPFCGLALDPRGHVCPRANGYRR
jgi:uncharacterized repeat protein (TIGR03847 family)